MTKVRLLGLALVAAMALSAVAAASAVAGTYDSEVEKVELTGNNTEEPAGEQLHTFNAGTVPVVCKMVLAKTAQLTGTKKEANVFTLPTITTTPEYSECTVAGQNATVDFKTNTCDYLFGSPSGSASPFTVASIGINCETGTKVITITATTAKCTITVGNQTTTGTSTLTNKEAGAARDVTLAANVSGITYTSSGGICGTAGTRSNGTYTGNITIKGYKNAAHTEQVGIFVTGP